jgi:hypothetical protein
MYWFKFLKLIKFIIINEGNIFKNFIYINNLILGIELEHNL